MDAMFFPRIFFPKSQKLAPEMLATLSHLQVVALGASVQAAMISGEALAPGGCSVQAYPRWRAFLISFTPHMNVSKNGGFYPQIIQFE